MKYHPFGSLILCLRTLQFYAKINSTSYKLPVKKTRFQSKLFTTEFDTQIFIRNIHFAINFLVEYPIQLIPRFSCKLSVKLICLLVFMPSAHVEFTQKFSLIISMECLEIIASNSCNVSRYQIVLELQPFDSMWRRGRVSLVSVQRIREPSFLEFLRGLW